MKIILVLVGFVLSMGQLSHADTLKDKDAAKTLAQAVMEFVEKGQTAKGVNLTKPYLIIPDHEFEAMLSSLSMQAPMIEQRFGKTIDTEFASIEEVGDSLMKIMYIQKFEKHLMRWQFYFYKPDKEWVLNTFSTDDKLKLMFSRI